MLFYKKTVCNELGDKSEIPIQIMSQIPNVENADLESLQELFVKETGKQISAGVKQKLKAFFLKYVIAKNQTVSRSFAAIPDLQKSLSIPEFNAAASNSNSNLLLNNIANNRKNPNYSHKLG